MGNKRKTPPGRNPAARCELQGCGSGFDRVAAFAVLALGGRNCQPHLFAQRPADEAPEGMRLPGSHLEQIFGGGSARPLQHIDNRRRFTILSGVVSRAPWCFLLWSGLLPRLGLNRRDVGATCASGGLFGGLRLGRRFRLFYSRNHVVSLGGDYRVTTSITLKAPESKQNQRWRMVGDGVNRRQMSSDVIPCQD